VRETGIVMHPDCATQCNVLHLERYIKIANGGDLRRDIARVERQGGGGRLLATAHRGRQALLLAGTGGGIYAGGCLYVRV
jgi:hypothetical protein